MDRLLEKFNLQTEPGRNRNYEELNYKHWNRRCDKISPKKQKPRTRWLHRRILSRFREKLMPILLKLFKKLRKEHFKAHFSRRPSPSYQNQTKTTTTKRKIQANITNEHRCKTPQQNFSKQNSTQIKKFIHHDQLGLIQGCKDSSIHANQSMWYSILTNWKIKAIWLSQ